MSTAVHMTIDFHNRYILSRHAWEQMGRRGLSPASIDLVMKYGRIAHTRGATIYVVGRKEVDRLKREGIELASVEGVQVVCSDSGHVLTVYRNRDFRGLRPRSRRVRGAVAD